MTHGLLKGLMVTSLAVGAAAVSGCAGVSFHQRSSALTQGKLTFEAPSACKSSQPVSLRVKGQATLQLAIKNTGPTYGVGIASKQWPAIFVMLDPGPNLRLDNLYIGLKSQNQPDEQFGNHEYTFPLTVPQLPPGKTKHLVAILTALKPGTRNVTISAWGGNDPLDIPSHPPLKTCSITVV
jgi:hypothetical protein